MVENLEDTAPTHVFLTVRVFQFPLLGVDNDVQKVDLPEVVKDPLGPRMEVLSQVSSWLWR